jgi:hypothetical protein
MDFNTAEMRQETDTRLITFNSMKHETFKKQSLDVYLQDSFTAIIDDPFLPMTHPIFPGGTSRTDRISTSGR